MKRSAPIAVMLIAVCAFVACGGKRMRWLTVGGEDGATLVREYRNAADRTLLWVLRIDYSAAQVGAFDQQWINDDLTLGLGTANGNVELHMKTSVTPSRFVIDGKRFDAAGGRVLTVPVTADGTFGPPVQSDLAGYKPLS